MKKSLASLGAARRSPGKNEAIEQSLEFGKEWGERIWDNISTFNHYVSKAWAENRGRKIADAYNFPGKGPAAQAVNTNKY
jgi:hypothetical protein